MPEFTQETLGILEIPDRSHWYYGMTPEQYREQAYSYIRSCWRADRHHIPVSHNGWSVERPDNGIGCSQCVNEVWDLCPYCGRDRHVTETRPCVCCGPCARCNRHVPERYTVEGIDGEICYTCRNMHSFRCANCRARYVSGSGDCGPVVVDGLNWCNDCADNDAFECESCDSLISPDGRCCPDEDYCHSCCTCRAVDGLIRYYSYRPRPEFRGTGPLFLGLEVEISFTSSGISRAHGVRSLHDADRHGVLYFKEDGSVSDGFEAVTHPMSLAWAQENMPWAAFQRLSDDGVESNDGCGIHVHVSRDGFGDPKKKGSRDAHMYRWLKFFYRSRDQLELLARRDSDRWGAFSKTERQYAARRVKAFPKGVHDIDHDAVYGGKWHSRGPEVQYDRPERYSAINCQNEHTLEVRIFRSSTNPTEIKAAMEVVHATVEYTRNLTVPEIVKGDGWKWRGFRKWVSERAETYPNLLEEMRRLGI